MNRAKMIFFGFLCLAAVVMLVKGSRHSSSPEERSQRAGDGSTPEASQASSGAHPSLSLPPVASNSKKDEENTSAKQFPFPGQGDLRDEVAKNPHITPRALSEFAKSLAPMMEQALKVDAPKSEVAATALKLKECVLQPTSMSLRALCHVNMKRIQKVHPDVPEADASQIKIPFRLQQLSDALLRTVK